MKEFLARMYVAITGWFTPKREPIPSKLIGEIINRQEEFIDELELVEGAKIEHKFKDKWKRTVRMPAKGKFVCESHYATDSENFAGRKFPKTSTEGIHDHIGKSFQLLKAIDPSLKLPSDVYNNSWELCWTPSNDGGFNEFGQGARGDKRPTMEEEMWQINMMFASHEWKRIQSVGGLRFLMTNPKNGRKCVVIAKHEIGPGNESFMGGVTPEVHWWLKSGNSTDLEFAVLKDQTTPLGPVFDSRIPLVEEKAPVVSGVQPQNPAYLNALKYKGKGEHDPAFVKHASKYWPKAGLNLKTIIGTSAAWCALFIVMNNVEVGQSTKGLTGLARSTANYGQVVDWKKNGIPEGSVVHLNHNANCSSGSSNHVTYAGGSCATKDIVTVQMVKVTKKDANGKTYEVYEQQTLAKSGVYFPGFGGNQGNVAKTSPYPVSHICNVRWPNEIPLPGPIEKSVKCPVSAGGSESTR